MFSIIVPSYNRKAEIPGLLESLEAQTVKNFEVVIVDDCSQEPVNIEGDFSFPVKLLRNQTNQGAAESRNIGAAAAQGEWLLFLDDDDRFTDNKCEVLDDIISDHQEINFIYHPAKCKMVNEGFEYVTKPLTPEHLTLENILLANKIGGMPMIAIKKSFFLELGGLSTELKSLEDYDFVLNLVSNPHLRATYVAQPLSLCAFHTKRASVSTNTTNTEKALAIIEQKYVRTAEQKHRFALNSLAILAYPHAMNLSRKAGCYYFKMFKQSRNLKHLAISLVSWLSPKLAINLKRYF
ncbi:MAG: glycosyltransferase family A protein [Lonepinella koalarum]|nr:glycosyltransferase family A protein [Lonepinella koalarum]